MRFAQAQQGVTNAIRHLLPITQVDNVLVLPQEKKISWSDSSAGILKGIYYPLEYQFLLDRQQYSLLLNNGDFFQFFYQFDALDVLESARLAYYPRPIATRDSAAELLDAAEGAIDRGDDDLYEHLYNWTELMEQEGRLPSNTSHIRFDYDREVVVHCSSHLQLGAIQDLRIPANFYPQPLAFVQLCEGLISASRQLGSAQLGFERNNFLVLDRPDFLIGLGCG